MHRIQSVGGYIIYVGTHKATTVKDHDARELFNRMLVSSVRAVDQHCARNNATFMLILDEQRAGNEWRERNLEVCTVAMFGDVSNKCRALIEPPLQAESYLFQTLQCADWMCGLVGRLAAYEVSPQEYGDWKLLHEYFRARVDLVALGSSGLQKDVATTAYDLSDLIDHGPFRIAEPVAAAYLGRARFGCGLQ